MVALTTGLVLLLCAIGTSNAHHGSLWKPRTEYEYELHARSIAGMPALQGQYSGVQYGGRVLVQGLTQDTVVMKMDQLWWSNIDARMSDWWSAQPRANETLSGVEQPKQALPLSGDAAVVRFDNGQVSSLVISKAAQDWEVNLIQGVASQLQMQMAPDSANSLRASDSARMSKGEDSVFHVMENAVTGRCEVQYEVSPAPTPSEQSALEARICAGKQYFQVTKTQNFSNCETFVQQTRGLPWCQKSGASYCGTMWTRNSLTQLIACGSQSEMQLVQSVTSGSMQAALQLRDESRASVFNAVNITVARVEPVRNRLTPPKDSVRLHQLGLRNQQDSDDESSDNSSDSDQSESVEVIRHKGKKVINNSDDESNESNYESAAQDIKKKAKNAKKAFDDGKKKIKYNQKKSSDEDSDSTDNSNTDENSSSNDDDESIDRQQKQSPKKGKKDRKTRSVPSRGMKESQNGGASSGDLFSASVQNNATLRGILQSKIMSEIEKAALEISQVQGPSTVSLERVAMAVRALRALGRQDLQKIQDQVKSSDDQWQLFRDVLAMCGSEPCVELTLMNIMEHKMPSWTARQALSQLSQHIAKPTTRIVKQIQSVYEQSQQESVKMAAALSMAELASRAPRNAADSTADFLAQELKKAQSKPSMRAALTMALGTTASPRALQPLLKIARDGKESAYQRAQAVLALCPYAFRAPFAVRDALVGLYHGPRTPAAVRISAVSLLLYVLPSLPVWQRLALSTWYEKEPAVASYVWSSIHTFALLQDPIFAQQSKFARLSMPLARPSPQGAHLAFNMVKASISAEMDRIVHQHVSYASPVNAAHLYYRVINRQSQLPNGDFEADAWAANPDSLLQSAIDAFVRRQQRPARSDVPHSTRSIHDQLSIERRLLAEPQGHLLFTLRPFVRKMFVPYDKDTPTHISEAVSKWIDQTQNGQNFKHQILGGEEMAISTVNEMGFPVNLRIQAPWLVRAAGSVRIQNNSSANLNITSMVSSALVAQLSVQNPWDTNEHVAAVHSSALVQLPASTLTVNLDVSKGRLHVRAEPQTEKWTQHDDAALLARLAVQPFTANVNLAELASESKSAYNASRLGDSSSQMEMALSPFQKMSVFVRSPVQPGGVMAWLKQSRPVLGVPVLGGALQPGRIEVVAKHPQPMTMSFSLTTAMKQRGGLQVVFPGDSHASPEPSAPAADTKNGTMYVDVGGVDFGAADFNASSINPFNTHVSSGNADLFVLSKVLSGMDGGRAYVFGMNVTSEGPSAGRYSALWTYGANLASRFQRFGIFARDELENKQTSLTAALYREAAPAMDVANAVEKVADIMFKAELVHTDSKSSSSQIFATVRTSRSDLKTRQLEKAASDNGCWNIANMNTRECRNLLASANIPDQYNLTVNYNDQAATSYGRMAYRYLQALKSSLWGQGHVVTDTIIDGYSNQLSADINVLADKTFAARVVTPRSLVEVTGVNVPAGVHAAAAFKARTADLAYCSVNNNGFVTLDGAKGGYKMTDCWHLLAKDCSGKSRIAVLARASDADNMELEVNIDNYQIALLTPQGVKLNGNSQSGLTVGSALEIRDNDDVRVMNIARARDGAVTVQMPDHGLAVIYGNSSVIVKAGASMRGRMCGICGDFDGNSVGELRNPRDKIEKNALGFASSYAMTQSCGKSRE